MSRKDREAEDREIARRALAAELALAKQEADRLVAEEKKAAEIEELRKQAESGE